MTTGNVKGVTSSDKVALSSTHLFSTFQLIVLVYLGVPINLVSSFSSQLFSVKRLLN